MRAVIRGGACAVVAAVLWPAAAAAQPGLYLPGGGAVHGAMAGASTATPADAIGALYWNPAAIARLGRSEVAVGGAALFPNIHLDSTARRLGRVVGGETRSDSGVSLVPDIGIVYDEEDSRLVYGLGLTALGGGGVNFPADPGNPVLGPGGLFGRNIGGPIYANLSLLQIAPTVAYRATDRLVVGLGPTVDVVGASFNPGFFAAPNDIDGRGAFPNATNSRPFWGGGFRAGVVYSATDTLDVGFGYTSPQWLEKWKFYSRNEAGLPRTLFLQARLPAIYSWGLSYKGIDRLLLSLDLRYFNYADTALFGTRIVDGGLGWDSTFAVALGGQYRVTDRAAVQAGYQYNTNPVKDVGTLFNIQAPAILQHTISVGTTLALTDAISASAGYSIGIQNSLTGPVREAAGVGVKYDAAVQSILFNLQFKFGHCGRKAKCGPVDYDSDRAAADPARDRPAPPAGGAPLPY